MKNIIKLTESDLMRIVKRVVSEQNKTLDKLELDNFIDPTVATNARGKGAGVYKSNVGYVTTKTINFGKDKMETGSDEVKKESREYKDLVTSMSNTPKPTDGKKYKVKIIGGASAVGNSDNYDNKGLAKRRADKLKSSLIQDVPGLNNKFEITTDGVVGKSIKKNSPEAYAEQFVKIQLQLPQIVTDKSFIESDKTITTHGGGIYRGKNGETIIPPIPIRDTETTICVTFPSGYKKALINLLYEFKTDNNIKLSYKESKQPIR